MRRYTIRNVFHKLIWLIVLATSNADIFAQVGNAPMVSSNFPGPLAIDGYLQRQGSAGDWVAGPGGTGNILLTDAGVTLVPLCLHFRDKYNTADDEVFSKGYLQDDPNTMKWGLRRANSKTDLNNILAFVAVNPSNGHLWIALAADRRTTGKNSTIDFEFLQNQVLMTGDINTGHDKGFFSAGRDGGRTIGDLVVSVKFQNSGGSFSSIEYFQWAPVGGGKFSYIPLTPPSGTAFTATNTVPIDVPFGAFGSNTYAPYTFIETAVDFTTMIGNGGALWIKSKSNDNFDDFYPPISGNTGFGGLTVNYFFYDLYTAQLNAILNGQDPSGYNFRWTAVGATNGTFVDPSITGSLSNYNIPDPIFSADTSYDCISYIYKVTASPISNPGTISGETYVVINSPCKIGKPINPDQMQQGELLNEQNNIDDELEVYPNPIKKGGTITLRTGDGIKDVQIKDMSGRPVQRLIGSTSTNIELKNLPQGIYLIQVYSRSSKKTTTKKLVVTN